MQLESEATRVEEFYHIFEIHVQARKKFNQDATTELDKSLVYFGTGLTQLLLEFLGVFE